MSNECNCVFVNEDARGCDCSEEVVKKSVNVVRGIRIEHLDRAPATIIIIMTKLVTINTVPLHD